MNAVEDSQDLQVKRDVKDVRMPMRLVYEALVKAGRLKGKQGKEEEEMDQEKCYYRYHGETTGHSIQECPEFLKMIQEMMNEGKIEFCGKIKEKSVSILLEEVQKPLTVFYRGGGQQAAKETPHVPTPKLVVKVPVPFHYASDKAMPWNYTSRTVTLEPQAIVEQKPEKLVNDIAGTGGMTRSGRCYAPITSGAKE